MFRALGYELASSNYDEGFVYEEWKRWDLDTPHEFRGTQCDLRTPATGWRGHA